MSGPGNHTRGERETSCLVSERSSDWAREQRWCVCVCVRGRGGLSWIPEQAAAAQEKKWGQEPRRVSAPQMLPASARHGVYEIGVY